MTQDINLTAGHNYIVTSADSVESAELNGNVLTIANSGKIDVIDLGAGSRTDAPVVMLSTPDDVRYVGVRTIPVYAYGNNWGGGSFYEGQWGETLMFTIPSKLTSTPQKLGDYPIIPGKTYTAGYNIGFTLSNKLFGGDAINQGTFVMPDWDVMYIYSEGDPV